MLSALICLRMHSGARPVQGGALLTESTRMRWSGTGAGDSSADCARMYAMQVGKQAAALWKNKADDAMQQVGLQNPACASPDVEHSRYDLTRSSSIRLTKSLLITELALDSCRSQPSWDPVPMDACRFELSLHAWIPLEHSASYAMLGEPHTSPSVHWVFGRHPPRKIQTCPMKNFLLMFCLLVHCFGKAPN